MPEEIPTVIFHVDLDAFYASVEQRDNPSLKGKPVIVGAAPGRRGVVSACSYEARRFGIHSAMPISQAYRRCPQGVYLPVRMDRYLEVSRQVMDVLGRYTPHLQQISVDEAFLDLTGTERLLGKPRDVGQALKDEVRTTTGLAITVGIGPNKYIAKLATNAAKPDGLLMVSAAEVESFLDGLALRNLWGVGEKTLRRLNELGILTVRELRERGKERLAKELGSGAADFLSYAVGGADPGMFSEEPKSHSLSSEVTFETDRADATGIERMLLELSHQVSFRMREEGWRSKTVNLKLRYHDFTTLSAQTTMKHWVSSAEEVFRVATALLYERWNSRTPIRLVGVGMSHLTPLHADEQIELFADPYDKKQRVEEAVLTLKKKLGDVSLTKASLLRKRGRFPESGNDPRP